MYRGHRSPRWTLRASPTCPERGEDGPRTAARDRSGLSGNVGSPDRHRRVSAGEDPTEPAAQDGGEETKKRAERERVAEAVDVESSGTRDEVSEVIHSDTGESAAGSRVGHEHDDQKHEQAEERGEHAVPAGAISGHPARDVATDKV